MSVQRRLNDMPKQHCFLHTEAQYLQQKTKRERKKILNRNTKADRGQDHQRPLPPHKQKLVDRYMQRTNQVSSYSRVTDTRLALGGADMGIVHLGGKLQAGQGLGEMCLQWADHDEHESLGVATKGELEEVRQLDMS